MHVDPTVRFSDESLIDIQETTDYYASACADLDAKFLSALAATIDVIAANPNTFQVVHKGARRAQVTKHPYGVFYREKNDLVRIIAVINLRRDPRTWQQRI